MDQIKKKALERKVLDLLSQAAANLDVLSGMHQEDSSLRELHDKVYEAMLEMEKRRD